MVAVRILLLLISPLSFAGDNFIEIKTKGTNNSITVKQIGNGNSSTILCGAEVGGTGYSAHTCTNATYNIQVDGNSNIANMLTVWSNNIGNNYSIEISGNDNTAIVDQDEDDNVSEIKQTGNSNTAEQLGSGDDNYYVITQTGNTKYAKILDFGDAGIKYITQTGTGAHNAYVYSGGTAHRNELDITQSDSGNKDADIFFYSSDNDVSLTQSGVGAHTANMTFNTSDYIVDVTQTGSTNQSYTAVFNCTAECTKTITITQQ